MKVIHKQAIDLSDEIIIRLPREAQILCFGNQNETATIWYICDPAMLEVERKLRCYGTGHPFARIPGRYIGTAQFFHGQIIWHLFEDDEGRS